MTAVRQVRSALMDHNYIWTSALSTSKASVQHFKRSVRLCYHDNKMSFSSVSTVLPVLFAAICHALKQQFRVIPASSHWWRRCIRVSEGAGFRLQMEVAHMTWWSCEEEHSACGFFKRWAELKACQCWSYTLPSSSLIPHHVILHLAWGRVQHFSQMTANMHFYFWIGNETTLTHPQPSL